jgi:hypothetical protein
LWWGSAAGHRLRYRQWLSHRLLVLLKTGPGDVIVGFLSRLLPARHRLRIESMMTVCRRSQHPLSRQEAFGVVFFDPDGW